MVRRSLIAAALLAIAAPLSAQSPEGGDEWVWTADRPDGHAPIGIFGGRTLGTAEVEVSYRFEQMNSRGVWFGRDSLALATTLQLYNDAPLTLSDIRHHVRVGFGLSDDLTLIARGEFAVLERETLANNGLIRTGTEALGDVEVGALYSIFAAGPYRLHVQGGAVIPTGKSTTFADTTMAQAGPEVALPYDMRPGGGTFGLVGGITGNLQNEHGSIGAQFRARVNVGSNNAGVGPNSGYTLGDRYEANGWAAYKVNDALSLSAGVRWQNWDNIDGSDDRLNTSGDPHNLGAILAGQRVMLPAGVNFVIPGDGPVAGQRLSLEAVYSMHHDYEGPQLGLDWGLNFGWTASF